MKHILCAALLLALLPSASAAQPDYPSAIWRQAYPGHWYTTGNPRPFHVVHDMEGYYWTTISYFQQSGTQASIYYCVNGLKNGSDSNGHNERNPNDPVAGEITQMVEEKNYAWHVSCWNRYMFGTEHEGFVSNPVWYSEAQYQASALLTRYLCDKYSIPKDRNHVIGHNQWQTVAWKTWMAANYPQIDTTCNNHTDPGQYWDWAHYMQLVIGVPIIVTQPASQTVAPGATATFSVVATNNPLAYQWQFNGSNFPGATTSALTLANVQSSDAGNYSVIISNTVGSVTSSNALLTVNLIISNLAAVPRPTSAVITWNTSADSTSQVEYGTTPAYGKLSPLNSRGVTSHIVLLSGLLPDTTYYFRAISTVGTSAFKSESNSFSTDLSLIVPAPVAGFSGVWTLATAALNRYSPYYKYATSSPDGDTAVAAFRPTIVTPGKYDVYVWYPGGTNCSTAVPVMISARDGDLQVNSDQTSHGGTWQLLAAATDFDAGTNEFVLVSNGTGEDNKTVMADAVRWVYNANQDKPTDGTIPSWWVNLYLGGDSNPVADLDGDGYSNFAEYLLATVPNDPASHFKFRIDHAGAGLQAVFSPYVSDRIYEVQRSTNMADDNAWTTITNLPVTVNENGEGTISFTNSPAARAFYRVTVRFAP
ncbi:MAG: N-acetylmuramyl-L-alanine amidase, negative regulator of AmpC, AmpD [Pedosphaera sp.]|nr:N-acetylmuramyl-L-alanine amidase, negative regulator of AmpC, AmpD [Pedosphaera sp.]